MPCFGARSRQDSKQAFPLRQMLVLSLCRICEPIAFMSIFPYIYYMIESFHIASETRQIALYAGSVTSVFAFCEFCSAWAWGYLSDKLGRKPILLTGLAGTGLSMVLFGFAPSFATALIARSLGGLLNGNIGVIQTTVAEIMPEKHQARGFAIMPSVWCVGSVIGFAIGGALADPVRSYPSIFKSGTIFDAYPYLLPNLLCASLVILGLVVGILFLEETHKDLRMRRDVGLEIGQRILRPFQRRPMDELSSAKYDYTQETLTLMHDEDLPDYRSTAPSPELSPLHAPNGLPPPAYQSIEGTSPRPTDPEIGETEDAKNRCCSTSFFNGLTKQVFLIIVEYGLLAYHTISAEQLLPVLLSMPQSDSPPSLPFRFTGGFALATKTIGFILSVQGVIQIVGTILIFPEISKRLGNLWTFRLTALSYPFLYVLVPYLTLVPVGWWRMPLIYLMLVWKVTAQAWTYPSLTIMLNNSAPKKDRGSVNGMYASSASLCRALGPTLSGVLQSKGLAHGSLGLPWWCIAMVAALGATLSFFFRQERRASYASEKMVDDEGEAGLVSPALYANEVNAALVAAESSTTPTASVMLAPASPLLTRLTLERDRRRDSKS